MNASSGTVETIVAERFSQKNWFSLEDLSSIFECDEKAVRAWMKSTGKLPEGKRPPCVQLGRELRFPKSEFLGWLAQQQAV